MTTKIRHKLLARIEVAGSYETLHYGAFASYSPADNFTSSDNDFLNQYICLRSTSKPFQTLACLELGLELTQKEIAICTGSHSGSKEHTEFVNSLLDKFKINWQELLCGEHQPLCTETNYAESNTKLRKLQNNCSGKHLMMLATCKLKGWDTKSYLSPGHPLQKKVLTTLSKMCEISEESINVSVDGCGLPTYSVPAKNSLKGFSKFNIHSECNRVKQIAQAMLEYPFYVSGKNRLDYELTMALDGKVVSKSGAGGLIIVSFQDQSKKALLLKMYDTHEQVRGNLISKIIRENGYSGDFSHKLFSDVVNNLHNEVSALIKTCL